jgi:hypothetical protein
MFSVQPMAGKMLLPFLGGAPAAWNTCMVFFQATLLGGYAYAHATTSWLGPRPQLALHLTVALLALTALPLRLDADPVGRFSVTDAPTLWLLARLVLGLGLPFFVSSATAPLLQRWLSRSTHPAARDPYVLYSLSNLGSLLAQEHDDPPWTGRPHLGSAHGNALDSTHRALPGRWADARLSGPALSTLGSHAGEAGGHCHGTFGDWRGTVLMGGGPDATRTPRRRGRSSEPAAQARRQPGDDDIVQHTADTRNSGHEALGHPALNHLREGEMAQIDLSMTLSMCCTGPMRDQRGRPRESVEVLEI